MFKGTRSALFFAEREHHEVEDRQQSIREGFPRDGPVAVQAQVSPEGSPGPVGFQPRRKEQRLFLRLRIESGRERAG